MRLISITLALILSSCSTTVYREGKPAFRTYANVTNLSYSDGQTSLSGDFDHATPTKAVGSIIKTGIATWGAAAMLKGTDNIVDSIRNNHPTP